MAPSLKAEQERMLHLYAADKAWRCTLGTATAFRVYGNLIFNVVVKCLFLYCSRLIPDDIDAEGTMEDQRQRRKTLGAVILTPADHQ